MVIFRYTSQAIKFLHNSTKSNNNSKSKNSSSEVSLEVELLCQRLEQNELQELELGWNEREFYTRKEIKAICRSLNENNSLTRVSVGHRLEKSALQDFLLPAIAPLPQLQVLTLAVHTNLKESTLKMICRNPSIQELEMQGARMQTQAGVILDGRDRFYMEDYAYEDVNIVGLLAHLAHNRTIGRSNLKSLKLANCGLQDEHIMELYPLPLERLCLAGNGGISSQGLRNLLLQQTDTDTRTRTRTHLTHLDMTDCGIESLDGVEAALERNQKIQELVLSRNYRIAAASDESFLTFFEKASQRLRHLDLSYCNLSGHHLRDIFRLLQSPSCRLESLCLEGCRNVPGPALCDMLANNQSLRKLVLRRFLKRPLQCCCYYELSKQLLERNYTLEYLDTGEDLPAELEFILTLNRAGRRILKEDGHDEEWATILAKASQRTDVLYWLIRNGAGALWSSMEGHR